MRPSEIVRTDDYANFPAIAAALEAIEQATCQQELSAARDALRKAELQRDIAIGLTDMWSDWERQKAEQLGLI